MINYGVRELYGREESFVETDEFSLAGDPYWVRMTAVYPYKDYANKRDELLVTLEWRNETTGEEGLAERVEIPGRLPQDNNLRRHSLYRVLPQLILGETNGNQ